MTRLALLSCALLVACGGGKQQISGPIYDFAGLDLAGKKTDDGGHTDLSGIDLHGSTSDAGDMTVVPADMTVLPSAPIITLTSPTTNVKSNNLVVTVSVSSPAMHTITGVTMLVGSDTTPVTLSQITTGVWQGATDVTGVPSGAVAVVVTATDSSSLTGVLSTSVTLDHGPTITFVEPTAATAKDSIPVVVTVADPLGGTLTAANVTIGVQHPGDVTVTASPASGTSITLTGTITFNDSQYSPTLTGNQVITVTATNADGGTATAQKTFAVDQQGPTISIQGPAENAFAGGLITVEATIDDTSGVNNGTVYAEFASDPMYKVALTPLGPGSDVYTALFDLTQLGTSLSYPTVSVTADDLLGNETTLGQSFYLDNVKPILSFDPGLIRVKRADGVCSEPFNPVGDDVVQDLSDVLQAISLRARIEDEANHVSGQTVDHPSGIAASSVRLIAAPAPTAGGATPVLIVNDKTVSGSLDCNAINPLLTPVASGMVSAGQYLSLPMDPLISLGSPNFAPDTTNVPGYCSAVGDAGAVEPGPMCGGSPLEYTLQYLSTPTPVIWSLPTVTSAPDPQCVGQQFDDGNLPEGWTCFAAIATDNSGNKAVSPVLRACIKRPHSPLNPHPCDTQSPPDCSGTYTPGTGGATGTTTNATCTQINFTDAFRQL